MDGWDGPYCEAVDGWPWQTPANQTGGDSLNFSRAKTRSICGWSFKLAKAGGKS